jgi:hypothetical protein
MDTISFCVDKSRRSKGRCVVQMAAYYARDKLYCEHNGQTYSTPKRGDLVYTEILLPNHAPREYFIREKLWNAVEQVEKSRDAILARTLRFSLPRGWSHQTSMKESRCYLQDFFVSRGMCADMFIHDKGDGNPHVHVLLTTRSLGEDGEWLLKQRRNYLLNADGTRRRDPVTGHFILGKSIKTNDWDDRENIELWRKAWAETCNRELERVGSERVTHMSYARQGLDIEPTMHMGRAVIELERRGIMTDRGDENRSIEARNRDREERKRQREAERERIRISERSR